MLDADGKGFGFFIYSEEDALSVIEDIDTNSLNSFATVPKIMCYHNFHMLKFPQAQDKQKYLQPAQQFVCNTVKYYWVITDNNLYIDNNNILSLAKFNKYKNKV